MLRPRRVEVLLLPVILTVVAISSGCKGRSKKSATTSTELGSPKSYCRDTACGPSVEAQVAEAFSRMASVQSDYASSVEVTSDPLKVSDVPIQVKVDSSTDALALDGDALLSPAEREKKLEQALEALKGALEKMKANDPTLEVKSIRCEGTATVSGLVVKNKVVKTGGQQAFELPFKVDFSSRVKFTPKVRVVMFYTSAPLDAVRAACKLLLSAKDVTQWAMSNYVQSDGIKGVLADYNLNAGEVDRWLVQSTETTLTAMGDVRAHGTLEKAGYRKIAESDDGTLDYVSGYFEPDWFYGEPGEGKPLLSYTWDDAANYCNQYNGRLPTVGDYRLIAERIKTSFGSRVSENNPSFWTDVYAKIIPGEWYEHKSFRRAYNVNDGLFRWMADNEKHLFVCLTKTLPKF